VTMSHVIAIRPARPITSTSSGRSAIAQPTTTNSTSETQIQSEPHQLPAKPRMTPPTSRRSNAM
jgi:hypothetical protein